MTKHTIGIIGAGNMGSAIIAGIHDKYSVCVCEQDKRRSSLLKKRFKLEITDLNQLLDKASIIVLAVKPQGIDELLKQMKQYDVNNKLIVSIAAGITTKYIEKALGGKVRVIRTMPNLPAQVSLGITGICKGKTVSPKDLKTVSEIFDSIGETVIIEEKLMDGLTAVSGSGPAYLFYFVECFEKAARSVGLNQKMSQSLVLNTIKGSISLLEVSGKKAGELRQQVTSKGGTTEAALKELMSKGIEEIFKDAVKAASKRSKELSR